MDLLNSVGQDSSCREKKRRSHKKRRILFHCLNPPCRTGLARERLPARASQAPVSRSSVAHPATPPPNTIVRCSPTLLNRFSVILLSPMVEARKTFHFLAIGLGHPFFQSLGPC